MRVSRRACTAGTARMHLTCREHRCAPSANTACPYRSSCLQRRNEGASRARGRRSSPESYGECTGGCLRLLHSPVVFVIACRTRRQREPSDSVCSILGGMHTLWIVCPVRCNASACSSGAIERACRMLYGARDIQAFYTAFPLAVACPRVLYLSAVPRPLRPFSTPIN